MSIVVKSMVQLVLLWWVAGVTIAVVNFGYPFVEAASSWSLVVDAWQMTLEARSR